MYLTLLLQKPGFQYNNMTLSSDVDPRYSPLVNETEEDDDSKQEGLKKENLHIHDSFIPNAMMKNYDSKTKDQLKKNMIANLIKLTETYNSGKLKEAEKIEEHLSKIKNYIQQVMQ